MKKTPAIVLLAVGVCQFAFADTRSDAIDRFLNRHLEAIPIPGFSVVVVEGKQVIYSRGFGVETLDGEPMSEHSSVAIGSQTKSLTAVAVMQLVEEGKIALDAPVTRYLPWFRTADGRQDEITIESLLYNASGLPSHDDWLYSRDQSEKAIERGVRAMARVPLVRTPGDSFEYANDNWNVLGLVISEVTGMSYSGYMQDRVLDPMGMARSTTALDRFDEIGVLHGFYTGIEQVRPSRRRFLAGALPAGSELRSTAADMGRYLVMLLNEGVVGGNRILDGTSVNALFEPGVRFTANMPEIGVIEGEAGYGMGWVEAEADGRIVHHHGGDAIVMGSWTMLDRERGLGVSLLYNGPLLYEYNFPSKVWVVNNLLHLAAGEPESDFGQPTKGDPTANDYDLPDNLRSRYVGQYLSGSGIKARVKETDEGYLALALTAGDLDYEYQLDFASEATVVLRNLSGAQVANFMLTPAGEVTGITGILGGVYQRRRDAELARLSRINSPCGSMAFSLPREWVAQWQGDTFTAHDPGSGRKLSGELSGDGQVVDNSETVETIGGRVWRKGFQRSLSGTVVEQTMRLETLEAGAYLSLNLTAPVEDFSNAVREVVSPLLTDLEIDPDAVCTESNRG